MGRLLDAAPFGLMLLDHDDQWDFFSLTEQRGQMVVAAEEFERLLRFPP